MPRHRNPGAPPPPRPHPPTGGARHIELHPTLAAWLHAYRPPGAHPTDLITPPTQLKWRLRALRTRAGYSPANPWQDDALRHTYATYYLKAGGDINRLQLNMGHANPRLLYTRYTNMAGTTRAMATDYWSITPALVNTNSTSNIQNSTPPPANRRRGVGASP